MNAKQQLLRKAKDSDIPDLVRHIHNTIKQCYPAIYSSEVVQFFLEYHNGKVVLDKVNNETVMVLFDHGKLVGTGYLNKDEIGGVYIDPQYQRKGYGSKIVKKLLNIAKTKNIETVWLDATPIAYKFYLILGFRLIEEKTDFVGEKFSPLLYYKMQKELI